MRSYYLPLSRFPTPNARIQSLRMGPTKKTNHIAMSIECLDTGKELLVVSQGYKNLRVIPYRLLEDRQGSLTNLMLF